MVLFAPHIVTVDCAPKLTIGAQSNHVGILWFDLDHFPRSRLSWRDAHFSSSRNDSDGALMRFARFIVKKGAAGYRAEKMENKVGSRFSNSQRQCLDDIVALCQSAIATFCCIDDCY